MAGSSVDPRALGKYLAESNWQVSQEIPSTLNVRDAARFKLELFCLNVFMTEYAVRLVWGDESEVTENILSNLYEMATKQIANGVAVIHDRCTVYGQALNNLPPKTSIGEHLGTTMLKAIDEDDIAKRLWVALTVSNGSIALKKSLETLVVP
jgi:hypothetical protein